MEIKSVPSSAKVAPASICGDTSQPRLMIINREARSALQPARLPPQVLQACVREAAVRAYPRKRSDASMKFAPIFGLQPLRERSVSMPALPISSPSMRWSLEKQRPRVKPSTKLGSP
jgi:hypothetical protein